MAISAQEWIRLTCAACGAPIEVEAWVIVDAGERPDLDQQLMDGELDTAPCPQCGAPNQSQVELLYHDPARRRVHFAVPAGQEEYRWRERAQALIYTLADALPEESQLPYLGDVQVHQEIEGLRRALVRRQMTRGGGRPSFGKPIPMPDTPAAAAPAPRPAPARRTGPAISAAITQALAASTPEQLRAIVHDNPRLLGEDADEQLRQLADDAFNQGDRDLSTALHGLRTALAALRSGHDAALPALAAAALPAAPGLADIPDGAYQALLQTASDATLMEAIRIFPLLLEPQVDELLSARIERTLEEGNERLATLIEDRADALAAMRAILLGDEALTKALEDLLAAADTDALELALLAHPALLTSVAQQALDVYIAAARSRGDEASAQRADQQRQLLGQVQAGMI